jgi:dipeptidyl aminopeptidase/acylaminoacyl peptidase
LFSFVAAAVWTIEALMALPALGDPQMRPDGQAYAYVLNGEVHRADLPNGKPVLVAKASRPRWSPDRKLLAYLANGKIVLGKKTFGNAVNTYSWSPDGASFAYLATDNPPPADPAVNRETNRYTSLWLQPLSGAAPKRVTGPKRHVLSYALSPDGKRAAVAIQQTPKPEDIFHVDLFEIDLSTGAETPLVTQPGRDAEPSYSPDGKFLAFHSQCGSLNYFHERHIGLVPTGGGNIQYVTRFHPYDVFRNGNAYAWSPDGQRLRFTAGQGTQDDLWEVDLKTSKPTRLAEFVTGMASFSHDLARAVFLKTNPAHPAEVVLWDNGQERPLTQAFAALSALPTIKSEVVQWKARDGLAVEGVLWLPFDHKPGNPVPVVTELHGGPTGVALTAFPNGRTYPTALFLQNGLAVFAPNFRGSSNYGAEFRHKNTLSQGIGDYDDLMTGLDELVRRGIADPNRLGVMGWSYGGYLSGATIAQTKRFKAASVGAPSVDWLAYYGEFNGSREVLWTYFGGKPHEVPENYVRHSYGHKLKDITTPTLLQIGALDWQYTAPIYQSLRDREIPVEYVVYPREGHGITEKPHQRDLMERNLRWMTNWLKR